VVSATCSITALLPHLQSRPLPLVPFTLVSPVTIVAPLPSPDLAFMCGAPTSTSAKFIFTRFLFLHSDFLLSSLPLEMPPSLTDTSHWGVVKLGVGQHRGIVPVIPTHISSLPSPVLEDILQALGLSPENELCVHTKRRILVSRIAAALCVLPLPETDTPVPAFPDLWNSTTIAAFAAVLFIGPSSADVIPEADDQGASTTAGMRVNAASVELTVISLQLAVFVVGRASPLLSENDLAAASISFCPFWKSEKHEPWLRAFIWDYMSSPPLPVPPRRPSAPPPLPPPYAHMDSRALKVALKDRGLSHRGSKAELQQRLAESFPQQLPVPVPTPLGRRPQAGTDKMLCALAASPGSSSQGADSPASSPLFSGPLFPDGEPFFDDDSLSDEEDFNEYQFDSDDEFDHDAWREFVEDYGR